MKNSRGSWRINYLFASSPPNPPRFSYPLNPGDREDPEWIDDPDVCPPEISREECMATAYAVDLTLVAAALECTEDDVGYLLELLISLLETGNGEEEYECSSGTIRLIARDGRLIIETDPPLDIIGED